MQKMQVVKSRSFEPLDRFQQRSKLENLHDCKSAIQYDEKNIKAYYRAAKVLMALDRFESFNYIKRNQVKWYNLKALPVEKQKLIRPLVKLRKKCKLWEKLKSKGIQIIRVIKRKIRCLEVAKLSTAEESAKYNASFESKMLRKIKELANKHSNSEVALMLWSKGLCCFDGPRIPTTYHPDWNSQKVQCPKGLKELLNDERYQQPLEEVMPKVLDKAETVLRNVKRKGAAVGDIMDLETENMLRPQILMEAFARKLLVL